MNAEQKPLSTADLARAAEPSRPPQAHERDMRERDLKGRDLRDRDPRDARSPLFKDGDAAELRKRWSDIQTGFVDEPRQAVEHADSLVADVMKRLAEGFTSERTGLEKQWDRGDSVTTEDLRVALQRYRSFFDRLLAA
jgi:hypothetical protein